MYYINPTEAKQPKAKNMKTLIGKKLKGTVAGLNATFDVVAIKNILGESVAILECVEYGAPLIKVSISDIEKPVRA